jgi:hypothetical protein
MDLANMEIATMMLLVIPLVIIELGLLIWALLDVIRREHVTGGNKVVWILIIVLVNIIGPIVYFIFGRKEGPPEGE